jgi:hypothetical protein
MKLLKALPLMVWYVLTHKLKCNYYCKSNVTYKFNKTVTQSIIHNEVLLPPPISTLFLFYLSAS